MIKRGSFSAHTKIEGEALKAGSLEWEPDERNKRKNHLICLCSLLCFNKEHFSLALRHWEGPPVQWGEFF